MERGREGGEAEIRGTCQYIGGRKRQRQNQEEGRGTGEEERRHGLGFLQFPNLLERPGIETLIKKNPGNGFSVEFPGKEGRKKRTKH